MNRITKSSRITLFAVALALGAMHAASAAITVNHGKIYETQTAGTESEGFVELRNSGATPDTLTGVTCAIADTTDLVGADGKTLQNVTLPPGQKLDFTVNGPHIRLQSTHFSILQGGAIPCSLRFQIAGQVLTYLYPVPPPAP